MTDKPIYDADRVAAYKKRAALFPHVVAEDSVKDDIYVYYDEANQEWREFGDVTGSEPMPSEDV